MPADDAPVLGPYEQARPGFEVLVAESLEGSPGYHEIPVGADGYQRFQHWDIWETDDLAEADEEKQRINEMQRSLGPLDDDTRFLRIQITCLRRCFWTFPGNVDTVIAGIGAGRPKAEKVSCEPPWNGIRPILAARGAAGGEDVLGDQRRTLSRAYMKILRWWTYSGDLDCLKRELPEHADLAETIYRRLGPPDELKALYVGKLRATLSWEAFPSSATVEQNAKIVRSLNAACGQAIKERIGDDEEKDQIRRQIFQDNGLCHHAFFRRVDHQIANIGAGRIVHLPGEGDDRQRIYDAVTNYVHVLGSWLSQRPAAEAIEIWPACEEVARRTYETLGESTPVKRWLVACLWKQLQDSQGHLGRGALDEQPDLFALPADALSP